MTREFDLIVFGATGFTGQYVAEEVAQIAEEEKITWAVAGRNVNKLKAILENVHKTTSKTHHFLSFCALICIICYWDYCRQVS